MAVDLARELAAQQDVVSVVGVSHDDATFLYRLVRSDPPRVRDFQSAYEKQRPLDRRLPTVIHMGLSTFDTPDRARARAVGQTFIAEVRLPGGMGIAVAKTFDAGHFTVWGEPEVLQSLAKVIDQTH